VCYGNPLRHKSLIPRLKQDLGDLKFIYMVRHPLKRIESDWKMRRHLKDAECCHTLSDTIERFPNILEHSLYWQQLQTYFQAFSPEQFLVIFFEDFVKNPTAETERALHHLGVTPVLPEHAAPTKARNSSQEYQVESKWMQLARQVPGFGLVKNLVPTAAIASLKQRFTKTMEYTPDWEPQVKQRVVDQLQNDVQSLLAFAGKPANYWVLN
jgi:hypothetical protein